MNKINSFSKALFQLLNENKIQYCVLRNYKSLPDNTGNSDLDLWVSSYDIRKISNILEKVSLSTNCKIVSFINNKYSPKFCFQNLKEGIQLDLFYGNIYFQNKIIFDENTIKQNIKSYRGIAILDDKFANLVSFIKELINNGYCESKYIQPLYESSYDLTFLELNLKYFNVKFINALYQFLLDHNVEHYFNKLYQLGKKSLSTKSTINRLKKIARVFNKKPGYVIAILGTDGSGKSTIINNITPILNEGFHKGIIYNHLRPNAIPDLGIILGKKEQTENKTVVSNPHAEKQSGLLISLIRWGYYLIDYTLGYMKIVLPIIHTKSKIFIFDRYYYDYYIDQKRSKTNLPHWIIKFGEALLPKPDLILCLGGDPEKIYKRKLETSLKEVTRQTKALQDFCKNHKKAIWINTCTDITTSTTQAMEAICNMMSKRYSNFKFK